MSEKWYYVLSGERKGPVDKEEIVSLFGQGGLGLQDYVWRKGFENWMKIEKVDEIKNAAAAPLEAPAQQSSTEELPGKIEEQTVDLRQADQNAKIFFVKTGADRGREEVEYGPFSLGTLKKLFDENRINGKTFVFSRQLQSWKNWMPLADVKGFEEVFEQKPPQIKDEDRRAFRRKPFIARMFIEKESRVFEGICRDVSIGGMQVLVDNFPVEVGKRISINAHPENSDFHFTASGEIVRKLEGGLGFSFRFINLSEDAVKAINSYTSQE